MENIKVREPQNPVEGEYTLCNKGEVAVFKNPLSQVVPDR